MDSQMRKKAKEQENRVRGERDKDQAALQKAGEPTPAQALRRAYGVGSTPGGILALQRTVGNQAVRRLLAERGAPGETQPDISRQDSAPDQGSNHNHPEYVTHEKEYRNRSDLSDAMVFLINENSKFTHNQRNELSKRIAKLESKRDQ